MKKIYLFLSLSILSVFPVSQTRAQPAKRAPSSALLYEITGAKLKQPSYLFGTVHIICEKDMFSPDIVKGYIAKTAQLILEFDMDDQAMIQKAVALSTITGGKSVKDYLTAEEYARLDTVYKNYLGISFDVLAAFKPMISSTYLLTSPKILGCQPPIVYDNYLAQTASSAEMPVLGLETVEEQMAVIDSEPLEKQLKALKEVGDNPQKGIDEFKTLYALYLSQDSDALFDNARDGMKKEGFSQEKMLDRRNRNWIPHIEKAIAEKPTFIAVGGGHLGGPSGVIALLRAKGYKLKPIRL